MCRRDLLLAASFILSQNILENKPIKTGKKLKNIIETIRIIGIKTQFKEIKIGNELIEFEVEKDVLILKRLKLKVDEDWKILFN